MQERLLKIIKHYGIKAQLKYFQSEIFELNEAIINAEYLPFQSPQDISHITEEIADVIVMLSQFKEYYHIEEKDILKIMEEKIDRQLKRIEKE